MNNPPSPKRSFLLKYGPSLEQLDVNTSGPKQKGEVSPWLTEGNQTTMTVFSNTASSIEFHLWTMCLDFSFGLTRHLYFMWSTMNLQGWDPVSFHNQQTHQESWRKIFKELKILFLKRNKGCMLGRRGSPCICTSNFGPLLQIVSGCQKRPSPSSMVPGPPTWWFNSSIINTNLYLLVKE